MVLSVNLFYIGVRKNMVYKIGNVSDLESIPIADSLTYDLLYHYARVLTYEYGEERNIDTDDGGFILYAPSGTNTEDIKACFDYTKHTLESAECFGSLISAMYILHNEFVITIIMSADNAPIEIIKEIN